MGTDAQWPANVRPFPAGHPPFEEQLSSCLDALYGAAVLWAGDPDVAADLVQETSLKAFRAQGTLRSPSRFREWVFCILFNTAKNHLRRLKRRAAFADIDLDTLLDDPVLADTRSADPERVLVDATLDADLDRAMRSLPVQFRETLWLVDVEEFSLAEASEILQVPTGTVASRVHRARRRIREELSGRRRAP